MEGAESMHGRKNSKKGKIATNCKRKERTIIKKGTKGPFNSYKELLKTKMMQK